VADEQRRLIVDEQLAFGVRLLLGGKRIDDDVGEHASQRLPGGAHVAVVRGVLAPLRERFAVAALAAGGEQSGEGEGEPQHAAPSYSSSSAASSASMSSSSTRRSRASSSRSAARSAAWRFSRRLVTTYATAIDRL